MSGSIYGCDPKREVRRNYIDAVGAINRDSRRREVWGLFARHSR